MDILILIIYTLSLWFLGSVVIKKYFDGLPSLLAIAGAFLVGTGIGVPMTYLLAVLLVPTGEPMLWATVAVVIPVIVYCLLSIKKLQRISLTFGEILMVILAVVFSTWLMTKTFHGGPSADGELFVGSNNVFDFAHSIGLMRSMSWGANIPFGSPFFAGLPMFYHFFFNFWTALWEYSGVPAVWAVNIPSILSFAALLIVIYFLPQIVAKQKPLVGWVAALLTVTNSSLTFLYVPIRNLRHLSAYPFAGPFDGSTISLFVTLNSFVNQRHLAFSLALALFLLLAVARERPKSILWGAVAGTLFLWNMVVFLLLLFSVGVLFLLQKEWKHLLVFTAAALAVGILEFSPLAGFLYKVILRLPSLVAASGGTMVRSWNILEYLWLNLGLLSFIAIIGYVVIARKARAYVLPFVVLAVLQFVLAAVGKRGFDQKLFSFFIIGLNVLAAVGVGWIWRRTKLGAAILLFFITVSGFVDLMPIKNEFAFPLIGKESVPVISWIRDNTPKDAVFVSYSDMIDPVVFAGRKNYFGFFGNIGWYDRSPQVKQIYAGDVELAMKENIDYILIPKWEKTDFPYKVNTDILKSLPSVYDDNRFSILEVR